ncbi:MAG TPA: glycosyltransferase family 39 protein [Thermodesulfobacteriota bacterium]|nr:glycosyltransferase family 39 protein [Thermodesulfobacteriota bacterium]
MLRFKTWSQSFFEDSGRKSSRTWVVLLVFTLALLILSVWGLDLSGRDSPRVAGIAREMTVTSDYLIPRLNGENFLEYPSLGYWPIALSLSMSKNPSDFLAFLPIIVLGTGTVLFTYLIGKTLAGEQIGLMAGFILATMSSFVTFHRHFRVDPVLLFFTTLSLYGFVVGYPGSRKRFVCLSVFYLAMAGAFLSKGIVGVAIPAATVVVFLVTKKDFKAIGKLLLNPAILFLILPIFLWVVSVWRLEGLDIFKEIIRQSIWRFSSPTADHAKPFYYYFTQALTVPLPWTILLFVLIWYRWRPAPLREPFPYGSLLWFALVWLLTGLIGLSFASAKRPLYLGPLYPSFALLAAIGWGLIREKFPRVRRWEFYSLLAILLVYIGTYLLIITPMEKKESLRPLYEAILSQQGKGPIYLVNPSETTRGASVFYLGEKIPVLNDQDVLSGRFDSQPGTMLLIDSNVSDDPLFSALQSKGYRLLSQKKYGKTVGVYLYLNRP